MTKPSEIGAGFLKKIRIPKLNQRPQKLSTFGGVFTPTVLTILGVIMYLRLGWVVGNAGLVGAIAIILLAKSITLCTGLSMSSITTNIRIGAGGAYSIISKSLGLEAGGSIGIPFYVSQMLSTALYIIGFAEGWLRIFPNHEKIYVLIGAWLVTLTISYVSAQFAIKVQYIILVILAFSIISFVLTPAAPRENIELIGSFENAGFWQVYAIFFPAVTGIMAGANLSGDLKDPRRSIPVGSLSGIAITLVIYIGLAVACAYFFSPEELRNNQMVMVDNAFWGPAVLAGILAATFSSALGSILGAPRILQALAEQKTVPLHKFFSVKSKNGEPRNAIVVTGILVLAALLLGDLDALAILITMFFLITYGMLNLVVFIQQSMKIISFRPTFKVPRFVPFLGALGCLFMMFLINPIFSIVAIVIIVFLYIMLERQGLVSDWGDIRGGMFLAIAERTSRIAARFPRHQISWKPDLLIPIENPNVWAGSVLFIKSITAPSGSIFAFTIKEKYEEEIQQSLNELLAPIKNHGILVNAVLLEDTDFQHGAKLVVQTLRGGAFRPNTLFLTIGTDSKNDAVIQELVNHTNKHEMGAIILRQHPRMAFGMQENVNLWLRDKSPNWHLAMLLTLQLQLNWGGTINLVTATNDEKDIRRLRYFLDKLSDQARLPSETEFHILVGGFEETLQAAPNADINIFGLGGDISTDFMRKVSDLAKSSCLFIKDSGKESALV